MNMFGMAKLGASHKNRPTYRQQLFARGPETKALLSKNTWMLRLFLSKFLNLIIRKAPPKEAQIGETNL